jgi:predicted component of type VI protein secretion system
MKLTLTVIASQSANAPPGTSRSIEGDQLVIGRGAGCDWILPDPLNHLSKRHCLIAANTAGYVVTDTSTNGVFVNDAGDALGNGATVAIQDGDRFALGDYVIEARIAESQPGAQPAMIAEDNDDPFGIGDIMLQRPSTAPLPVSPPARTPGFAAFGAEPPLAAPFSSAEPVAPFAPSDSGFGRPGLIPEDISWLNETSSEERAPPPPADSGLAGSDHLAGYQAAFVPPRVEGAGIPDQWLDDDHARQGSAASSRPASPAPARDGNAVERTRHLGATSELGLTLIVTASPSPEVPRGTRRAIANDQIVIGRGADCDWSLPDPQTHLSKRHCTIAVSARGWVITDTSTNGVFVNESGTALGSGATSALHDGDRLKLGDYVFEAQIGEASPELEPTRVSEQVEQPYSADAANEPPQSEGGGIPDDWEADAPSARPAAPPSRPQPAAAPPPPPRAAAVPPNAMPPNAMPPSGDLIAAFLGGADLPPDSLKAQDAAAVLRAAGRAYRAAVVGLAEILRTRALIKSEFHIEKTRIGAIGNNPMKFLENADEIMAAMVGTATPGFQEAGVALRDGIHDLKAHQLAMVAAIQVALARLLGQLDPEILKSRLEKRSLLDAVLPGARKARYWEAFEESYKSIATELEEDFNGVFGKAFAEAYEDELRRP